MLEEDFDHTPMIINVYPLVEPGKQPFKYFSMWSSAPNFQEIIADCWRVPIKGQPMFIVIKRLKLIKSALKKLNAEGFSDLRVNDIIAHKKLITCQEGVHGNPKDRILCEIEMEAAQLYKTAHKRYISFFSQKAEFSWCTEGDENTSLFHSSIKQRRLMNIVYAIHDDQGVWRDNVKDVNDVFLNYYKSLLGSPMTNRAQLHLGIINMGPVLDEEECRFL